MEECYENDESSNDTHLLKIEICLNCMFHKNDYVIFRSIVFGILRF